MLAHVRLEKTRLRQPTSANSPQTGNKRNPRSIDFPKRLHNRTVLPARYCHNAVLHSTIKKYLRTPRTPSRQQSERKQPGNVTIFVHHSPINSHRAQASCCSCAEHSSPFLMPPNGVAPRGMQNVLRRSARRRRTFSNRNRGGVPAGSLPCVTNGVVGKPIITNHQGRTGGKEVITV